MRNKEAIRILRHTIDYITTDDQDARLMQTLVIEALERNERWSTYVIVGTGLLLIGFLMGFALIKMRG